jgi:hypothetical protein
MAVPAPTLPDYPGANLASLVPSLLAPPDQRPDWVPEPARSAEQVVLLVLDGLGWLQLQDRLALAPHLRSMSGAAITSVVPSTTACALTSLVTGVPPNRHGIVGYRVVVEGRECPEVMNVLKWRTSSGDARSFVEPGSFQLSPPFLGREVPVVSRADFAGTAFTEAHQRGARQVGWYQASSLAVEVKTCLSAGEPLVYAYYDGIDRIAHVKGLGEHYDAELVAVDRLVGDLLDSLSPGSALLVTADHGQVDVGRRASEIDSTLLQATHMVSGEARFRWLHARDSSLAGIEALADQARQVYGHEAWVLTCSSIEEQGWFGGAFGPTVRARLGDVAVVPFEPVAYLDRQEGESTLVCRHGSLTPEEMWVPLVAGGSGRGRI